MPLRERRGATVAFRLHGHQHYHHVFFGKDMMNLDGEDTAAQCQGVFEKSDDRVMALVIARQRTMTRHMPGDRCVECLKDCWNVAIGEVVVRLTDDGRVGRDHGCSMTWNLALSLLSNDSRCVREEAGTHRYNVGTDTPKLCATSCGG